MSQYRTLENSNNPLESGKEDAGAIDNASEILLRMLRTAYGYANDKAESVYLYIQIGDGTAGMGTLYRINGVICEAHELNEGKLPGHTFDVSVERQQELFQFLSTDLKELIQIFINKNASMPTEIWSSIDVETDDRRTSYGYNLDGKLPVISEAVTEWKNRLSDPLSHPGGIFAETPDFMLTEG